MDPECLRTLRAIGRKEFRVLQALVDQPVRCSELRRQNMWDRSSLSNHFRIREAFDFKQIHLASNTPSLPAAGNSLSEPFLPSTLFSDRGELPSIASPKLLNSHAKCGNSRIQLSTRSPTLAGPQQLRRRARCSS